MGGAYDSAPTPMGGAYDSAPTQTPMVDSRLRNVRNLAVDSRRASGRILADYSDIRNKNGANIMNIRAANLFILRICFRRHIILKIGSCGGQYAPVFV